MAAKRARSSLLLLDYCGIIIIDSRRKREEQQHQQGEEEEEEEEGESTVSTRPMKHIKRALREDDDAADDEQHKIKTYRGFCVHRSEDIHHHLIRTIQDRIVAAQPRPPTVLELIEIVCEHIPLLPTIEAAAERYDDDGPDSTTAAAMMTDSSSSSSMHEIIPVSIDLPKSMSINRVRIAPSTSQRDLEDMVKRIRSAVQDLEVTEIVSAARDPLSALLPLAGYHPVESKLKVINVEKDSTYEEYKPVPCSFDCCPICG